MGVNQVQLLGYLGKDPELRHTPNGLPVANLSLATSESWTDKSGQKQQKTEWHRLVVFNKLAEIAAQYLTKGRQIYIQGKLQTRQYTGKDGVERYQTEIVVDKIEMLGGGPAQQPQQEADVPTFTEEDIPF